MLQSARTRGGSTALHPGRRPIIRVTSSQLIRCAECKEFFIVGGAGAAYLFCPAQKRGTCTCKTQLRRDRAERMILDEIGSRILEDPAWRSAVAMAVHEHWQRREATIPGELAAAEWQLAELDRKIKYLVDAIENGDDAPELASRRRERREERERLARQIERLRERALVCRPEPGPEWVDQQLAGLGTALKGNGPAAAFSLRGLVGGEIVVQEIRRPGRQRHYLQGCLSITSAAVAAVLNGTAPDPDDETAGTGPLRTEEITIDFVDPSPMAELSERAKALADQGILYTEIAEQLGKKPSYVTKLLRHWHESRGLEYQDGRTRRETLPRKQRSEPEYRSIADEAVALWNAGESKREIGRQFDCSDHVVKCAIRYWHRSRGLPVPTEQSRRAMVIEHVKRLYDKHLTLAQIATRTGYTVNGLRKMLKAWFRAHGETMPDGRTRRHERPAAG